MGTDAGGPRARQEVWISFRCQRKRWHLTVCRDCQNHCSEMALVGVVPG